jgi:hypothetical protein
MRKSLFRTFGIALIATTTVALWRIWSDRVHDKGATHGEWDQGPFPFPPAARAVATPPAPASLEPWIEPLDGACPLSHPVKAKLSSGIYHVPGGMNYERTRPDRCYVDGAGAEHDGLRAAKM